MSPKRKPEPTGFYVGSREIAAGRTDWGRNQTFAQAVERTKSICAETGEPQIVVEIVARIERLVVPVKVTMTRTRRGKRT